MMARALASVFPRAAVAAGASLTCALWIPLVAGLHPLGTLEMLATESTKATDPAFVEASRRLSVRPMPCAVEDLDRVAGQVLTPSKLVLETKGVPSIAEASALVAAGRQACPIAKLRQLSASVDALLLALQSKQGISLQDFLSSPSAWEQIREAHVSGDSGASFVDYFWTVRLMHGPLFQLGEKAIEARSIVARGRAGRRRGSLGSGGLCGWWGELGGGGS